MGGRIRDSIRRLLCGLRGWPEENTEEERQIDGTDFRQPHGVVYWCCTPRIHDYYVCTRSTCACTFFDTHLASVSRLAEPTREERLIEKARQRSFSPYRTLFSPPSRTSSKIRELRYAWKHKAHGYRSVPYEVLQHWSSRCVNEEFPQKPRSTPAILLRLFLCPRIPNKSVSISYLSLITNVLRVTLRSGTLIFRCLFQ